MEVLSSLGPKKPRPATAPIFRKQRGDRSGSRMSVMCDEVLAVALHAALKPRWRGDAHLCRSTRFAVAEYPRIRSVASSMNMRNTANSAPAVQPALEEWAAERALAHPARLVGPDLSGRLCFEAGRASRQVWTHKSRALSEPLPRPVLARARNLTYFTTFASSTMIG
jgi:hypothetical protein